jgi:Transposase IS66 family
LTGGRKPLISRQDARGFSGLLQVDGYAASNRLAKGAGANDGVTLATCFAHVRKQFYELHVNESSRLATQTITTMAALWKVEEDIRGKDPATRVKARQERSAAVVARLFDLWETELPRLSGKSKLEQHGITYTPAEKSKSDLYLEALPLFTRGLISIPNIPPLIRELRLLERQAHRGGRESVDHPRRGSDDLANSVCGCSATASVYEYDATLAWV